MYNNLAGDLARNRNEELARTSRSPQRQQTEELHRQRKRRRPRRRFAG
jgi:hypothetical protein